MAEKNDIASPPPETAQSKNSKPATFGAYGTATGTGTTPTTTKTSAQTTIAATSNPLAFTENDKRWLKDLGITTTSAATSEKIWATPEQREASQHKRWAQTYGGRLAIRSISRGIVGSAFFAAAQMYGANKLSSYTPDKNFKPENWLQYVSRAIDNTAGKGIFHAVRLVAKAAGKGDASSDIARRAVLFRDTRAGYKTADKTAPLYTDINGNPFAGRSLGQEAVTVTFDFATMSFADYMTRYVLALFDPNAAAFNAKTVDGKTIKGSWMKDGKLHMPTALKDVLKNMWTGISYAAGEDMAVALPYVYYLRLQRKAINHFSPGFKYDSDNALNGGSLKVDTKGKVIGNYQMEGMLDLGGRFTIYNVGTKIFRDSYTRIANRLADWWDGGHKVGLPSLKAESFTPGKMVNGVGTLSRYLMRTTIKTFLYMIPSTFFFYITRTPQSKSFGLAINPEKGPMGIIDPMDGSFKPIKADRAHRKDGKRHYDVFSPRAGFQSDERVSDPLAKPGEDKWKWKDGGINNIFNSQHIKGEATRYYKTDSDAYYEKRYSPFTENKNLYAEGVSPPWYEKIVNPLGRLCYGAGSMIREPLMGAAARLGVLKKTKDGSGISPNVIEDFSHRWANASISYTPYFMTKTDLGSNAWDTVRTDMGIDRMLTGVTRFNWGEFKGGLREVFRSIHLNEPFPELEREKAAQEAMKHDTERQSNEAYQQAFARGDSRNLRSKKGKFATEDMKTRQTFTSLRDTPRQNAPRQRNTSFTAEENAKHLIPPTSTAIH